MRRAVLDPAPTFAAAVYASITEQEFQETVIAHAKAHGYRAYHTHDSRRSEKGFPDLVITGKGRCLFWELKSEKGRLSAAQIGWLEALQGCPGVEVRCFRPSDWSEIEEVLQR